MGVLARMTAEGSLVLPEDLRLRHGLAAGTQVMIAEEAGRLVIRRIDASIETAQAIAMRLAAGRDDMSVDAFLADRRREAERE